ncbi:MAG TPA: tetratricopeptide repeat protein [Polyangia bacterium]|jgi:hypothetical protein|nr:tetratricopeptide repeat protein [Polyangia bacterium]
MDKLEVTVAVTGMNATDNPAPGVAVARSLRHEPQFAGRVIGLGYDTLDPGFYAEGLLDGGAILPYPSAGRDALRDRLHWVRAEMGKAEGASYFVSLRTGWLAYLAGDHTAAEAGYREAIAAKPGVVKPKIGLTLVLYVAQKWKALETVCKQVLAVDAKHPVVRARMAAGYYGAGNYPDAAAIYRKLVDEYPGELDYQTGHAWALQRMGKREEAQKLFQAVLAVSPDNLNANQGAAAK